MTALIEALISAFKADTVGVSEIQTVTISPDMVLLPWTDENGDFLLDENGDILNWPGGSFLIKNWQLTATSAAVDYGADLATLQAAYDTVYGAGNTVVAGTVASHTLTFAGTLANKGIKPTRFVLMGLAGVTGYLATRTVRGRGALMTLTTGIKQAGVAAPARTADFDFVTLSALQGGATPTYARDDGEHPAAAIDVTFSAWSNKGGNAAADIADSLLQKFQTLLPDLSQGQVLNVNVLQPPIVMPQAHRDESGNSVVMIACQLRYSVEMW